MANGDDHLFVHPWEVLRRAKYNHTDLNGTILKPICRWYNNLPSTKLQDKITVGSDSTSFKLDIIKLCRSGRIPKTHLMFGRGGHDNMRSARILTLAGKTQAKYLSALDSE